MMDVLSLPLGGPFKTLIADPPWPFDDKLPGPGRGAAKHYPLMTLEMIAGCLPALEANGLRVADDAHLYLWVPNSFLDAAYDTVRAWGFESKQLITWVKVTSFAAETVREWCRRFDNRWAALNVKGVARVGMGHGYRNCTEQLIVAKRGKLPYLRKDVPNVFFAPRQVHSRKPALFYDIAESMSPGPYLELFARPPVRPGWDAWGNEVEDVR